MDLHTELVECALRDRDLARCKRAVAKNPQRVQKDASRHIGHEDKVAIAEYGRNRLLLGWRTRRTDQARSGRGDDTDRFDARAMESDRDTTDRHLAGRIGPKDRRAVRFVFGEPLLQ